MPIETVAKKGVAGPEKEKLSPGLIEALRQTYSSLKQSKVSTKEKLLFTEHLALVLETGTNLHEGLLSLEKQLKNPTMIRVVQDIILQISEGKSFSYALSLHPEVFSQTYTNLVSAGEQGGFLHKALNKLNELEESQADLKSQIVSTFSYPAFLGIFSVLVVVFILVKIFPNFETLFEPIYDQLPVTTRVLMAASQLLIQHAYLCVLAVLVLLLGMRQWQQSHSYKLLIDKVKMRAPLIKDVASKVYLSQFMRVLGLSLSHGVSLIEALKASKEAIENHLYRSMIENTIATLESGGSLTEGFENEALIPDMVTQMVATGEKSGNLAPVLLRIGQHYEKEFHKQLTLLSKLLEPLMLVFMGVLVGVIVSSLILPIFKLSTSVH